MNTEQIKFFENIKKKVGKLMNNNLTEMVFILDMSGSMKPFTEDTIGGYNSLLNEQKKQDGDANVTTVLFDDRYIVLHDRKNLKDVEDLTTKEYVPCGCTAMLDAVGKTLVSVGKKLADMKEEDRPGNVVVTIITDGEENSSKEYSWKQIQDMIKEQREKYNWLFTFIGANIDVKKVSGDLGIDSRMAKKYTASKTGTRSVFKAMCDTMSYSRKASADVKSRGLRDLDAEMSAMSDIMDENIE